MGKDGESRGAPLTEPLLEILEWCGRRKVWIKKPGLKDPKGGLGPFRAAEAGEQLEEITQLPAWLPAVADAREKSAGRHIEFLDSPIDESGVTQSRETPLNELLGRPLIT